MDGPKGMVWRSELGGWVTPEAALADARARFSHFHTVGMLEIGCDEVHEDRQHWHDPGWMPHMRIWPERKHLGK